MDKKARLTILVSNYSKADRVVQNISFLLKQKTDFGFKIYITDTSCSREQIKIIKSGLKDHPEVELIENKKNLGYSKGHNMIHGREVGEFLLVVNPDVLFKEEDSLQKMVDYMSKHPDVAVLGPQQINDDGKIAMSVRAFPKFHIQVARRTFLRKFFFLKERVAYDEMKHLDYSKVQDVDWLQSSCIIIRRDFWDKIKGFNEFYFLFMADTELCFEAWRLGKRVVYFPETRVYADGKRVSEGGFLDFFFNWILRQHVIDSLKYSLKHLFRPNPRKKI